MRDGEQSLGAWLRRGVCLALIALVRLYQLTLSPVLGPSCRFAPSCSVYALGALERHGPWRGSWLAARRLLRCHPFHPGGFDPVPSPAEESARAGSPRGVSCGS